MPPSTSVPPMHVCLSAPECLLVFFETETEHEREYERDVREVAGMGRHRSPELPACPGRHRGIGLAHLLPPASHGLPLHLLPKGYVRRAEVTFLAATAAQCIHRHGLL